MKRRQVKKLRKKFNSLQRTIVRTEKCECRCGDSGSGAGGSSALSGCDCGGAEKNGTKRTSKKAD